MRRIDRNIWSIKRSIGWSRNASYLVLSGMRRIDRQRLQKKADALFSKYIRQRDGRCLYCSATYALDCAHVVTGRHYRLRYDPLAAITLCRSCHSSWHLREKLWQDWFSEKYPERWEYVQKYRYVDEKPDYDATIKGLKGMLSQ